MFSSSGFLSTDVAISTPNPLPAIAIARSLAPPAAFSSDGLPLTGHDATIDEMATHIDKEKDDSVRLLSQLSVLNVALYQHPLRRDRNNIWSQKQSSSESSHQASSHHAMDTPPRDLNRSELGIGKLLEMTSQLQELVTRIRVVEEAQPPNGDKSTALMALSCYIRFKTLYTRAIEILQRVRNRTQHLNDIHELIPNLVIDGSSMSNCYDVHLDLIINLCEQTHNRIKNCVQSGKRALGMKT